MLRGAVRDGFSSLTWDQDSFAYDETAKRYRGLRGGQNVSVTDDDAGLLVRSEVKCARSPLAVLWQARVTHDWRCYFRIDGDAYYLLDIIAPLK